MNQNKYRIDIHWNEEDQCYLAVVPELPHCLTHGDSMEEALQMAQEAIEGYIMTLKQEGLPVPCPLSEKNFSGKIPLRIDPSLHRNIALKAATQGLSLNRYIESTLKKSS